MVSHSAMALLSGTGAAYLARMSMSAIQLVTGILLAPKWLMEDPVMVANGTTAQPSGMSAVNHATTSKKLVFEQPLKLSSIPQIGKKSKIFSQGK